MTSSGRDAFKARVAAAKKKVQSKPAEPASAVGVALLVAAGPAERPGTVEVYTETFLSDVWRKPLRQLISQSVSGRAHPRRAGLVTMAERPGVLRELLVHPDLGEVALSHHDEKSGHHESLSVGTRVDESDRCVRVHGYQTLDDDPARGDAWVNAMLILAEKVDAHHGVVPVMNPSAVGSEGNMGVVLRNGVDQYPYPEEHARMRAARSELGRTYVRFPRWGTLYGRAHVEALGGIGKIVEAVQPAVVRELPAAVYVQLTDSVATATGAEAVAKQRAFTELVAPLLPPPVV